MEVINGPEKGKQGTVLKVLRAQNRVVIEGVNVVSSYCIVHACVSVCMHPYICVCGALWSPSTCLCGCLYGRGYDTCTMGPGAATLNDCRGCFGSTDQSPNHPQHHTTHDYDRTHTPRHHTNNNTTQQQQHNTTQHSGGGRRSPRRTGTRARC